MPIKRAPHSKNEIVQIDIEEPKVPAAKNPSTKENPATKNSPILVLKQSPSETDDIPSPAVDVLSVGSLPCPSSIVISENDSESTMVEVDNLPQEKSVKVTVLLEWMFDILSPDRVVLLGYKK